MEASSVKEHSISMSSCSPIDFRSIELLVTDDKREPLKCDHFTIRGYVAEVRKKDPKICWPFSTLRSYNPSEDAMLLPPLSLTKFRRWDCETCQGMTIFSASVIENGRPMNAPNDELKSGSGLLFHNSPMASYRDPAKLFSGLQRPYKENTLERRPNAAYGSVDFCNSEYHSSFCCGNKKNESDIAADLTKEGLQMYGPEHIISYENSKQRKDCVNIDLEGNMFGTEDKGETSTVVGEKSYVNTSKAEDFAISTKENEVISICGISSAKMCENLTSKRANVASVDSKDDQLVSRIGNMKEPSDILSRGPAMHVADCNHDSNGLENTKEASETDLVVVNKMSQNKNTDTKLEKGERNTVVGAKAYVTSSHAEDAAICTKENEVISICGISSAKMCGNLTSKSNIVASVCSKADQQVNRNGNMKEQSEIFSGGSAMHVAARNHDLENIQEASETDLIMVNKMFQNQNNDAKLERLSGNLKHRKVRKVRLLNDIMRNEDIYMPGKVCTFKGETGPNKNIDDKIEDTSEGNAQNSGHGRPCVSQKKDVNQNERKKKNSAIQNDNGEDFQMHVQKKMSTKRDVTTKRDVQNDDSSNGIPKAGKDPSHKTEVNVTRLKQEAVVGSSKKFLPQMKVGRPHLSHQQDNDIGNGNARKNASNGHILQKSVCSSKIAIISEKFLQHDLKIQDRIHQKNASSNKKRKLHQVVDEQSYGMRLSEGRVTKKRRTTRTGDKRSADDIPMDIVELLANNLQQKRMMNTECTAKRVEYLSQITDNFKEGGVAKHHGNEGTEAIQKELIQQRSQADFTRNGVCVTGTSHESAYDRPKLYCSSTISDRDNKIYLNQQKMTGPSPMFNAFSHNNVFPMSREELRATVQYENSFPHMFSRDRSNITGQIISQRNFGKAYDASTVLLSGETSKMSGQNSKPNLNLVNMESSNNSLKTDQSSVHLTGWQRSSKSPVKHTLAPEWKNQLSLSRGIPTTTTSVLEIGNGCYSNAKFQADQYTSGNILSLNFPAVRSGGSFHALSHTNHAGIVQQAHLYPGYGRPELLRSGVGVNNMETIEHQINSCKPVRPVPRIGLLGALLQKEIATRSGNFRPQTLIKEGCSTQMRPPHIDGSRIPSNQSSIPRADNSKWVIPNVASTSHPECSRTSNGTRLVGFRSNEQCVQPWRSRFSMEICTINRNPADFTLPNEGSVYMRGGLRTKFLPTSKRQKHLANGVKPKQKKVRKLNALKNMMTC